MTRATERFTAVARSLHWAMAVMVVAMLLIGLWLAGTVSPLYSTFLDIHRPLGIAVLVLVAVRLAYRLTHRPPPLPASLPRLQRLGAKGSHLALYGLMFAMPHVGWEMLSAARFPSSSTARSSCRRSCPVDPGLYAILRQVHTVLALLLIAVILLHLAAALFHRLVRRDGVFESMASLKPTEKPVVPAE